MKRLLILSALAVVVPLSASADQFGMLHGFITTPSGSTKVFANRSAVTQKPHKPATGFFLGLENLRVSYLEYSMLAAEGLSIYLASKKIDVQVLSFEYQRLFPEGYFFHAGLANFTSQVEYHWDAFESSYDDEATDIKGATNKVFDLGLIGGVGFQVEYGKGFLGAEYMLIPGKTVTYDYTEQTGTKAGAMTEEVDLGLTMVALFVGMNF